MKVFRIGSVLNLLVALVIVGCGNLTNASSDDKKVDLKPPLKKQEEPENKGPTSFMVANLASLPACNSSIKNSLAFLKEEKLFYGCDGTAWALVEVKGDKGDAGAKGDSGSASAPNKITASLYCNGDLSTLSSGARTLNGKTVPATISVSYWSATTGNGDTFASASVEDTLIQASGTRFYSNSQNGAATAGVQVTSDFISPSSYGWWNISVNRQTGVTTVRYTDDSFGLAPNYLEWTLLASACSIQNYP
jgi:hypothetical protein